MAKYLFQARYTAEGLKGLLKEGGTGRRAAIAQLFEKAGGKLESAYYAFGGDDVFIVGELPDNVAAAAVSLNVAATGTVAVRTVVLLEAEEIDRAAKKTVQYRAPGK